jgi:photosystem II stability/assembly factor-like uncharacterized protein
MKRATTTISPRRKTAAATRPLDILICTVKGAFVLKGSTARERWRLEGPHFLGSEANHLVLDPRDRTTLLLAARTGHLGPTVFRSTDQGKTWREARRPPAFPKVPEGAVGRTVDRVFYLAAGHASQPGVWWAGTVPHALFRSQDGGETWDLVDGFSDFVARLKESNPTRLGETPGGAITHSLLIDPRDASHMYVSLSTGGFFETTDGARGWKPMNEGCLVEFLPEKYPEYGQDPHCVVMSPANPDRLYQQNHCGVYRLDRPGVRWERIGRNLPAEVGDIGFPIVAHPRDQDTVWVFPMDGTNVWPRTSPGGKPAAFRSRDGGMTWKRQAKGFPSSQAWFSVLRQAMTCDDRDPVGLYLGTTAGEVWASRDEGGSWSRLAEHLPRILSIGVAQR